jgi:ubiquinone/menaquinone biosynthesis C-methylase UbiE
MDDQGSAPGGTRDGKSVRHEYTELAPFYDTRWRAYVEASIRATLQRMHAADGERILDIGCGTGALLQALQRHNPSLRLTGIDAVPAMLAIARQKQLQDIALLEASAEQLPFADNSFDRIVSSSAFHYFPHPAQALAEMRRVLVPGGELVLTDWCLDYVSVKVLDWWLRLRNTAHHRTYGLRELQEMLVQAGFTVVKGERYRLDWVWGMMTTRAAKV